MKKYDVEIRENYNDCWDSDAFQEKIEAESAYEAFDLAKTNICECANAEYAENFQYRVIDENGKKEIFNGNE